MDINEKILSELQQINTNLIRIAGILSGNTTSAMTHDRSRIGSEIEDRIRKARQEAESRMAMLKSGNQTL